MQLPGDDHWKVDFKVFAWEKVLILEKDTQAPRSRTMLACGPPPRAGPEGLPAGATGSARAFWMSLVSARGPGGGQGGGRRRPAVGKGWEEGAVAGASQSHRTVTFGKQRGAQRAARKPRSGFCPAVGVTQTDAAKSWKRPPSRGRALFCDPCCFRDRGAQWVVRGRQSGLWSQLRPGC